MTRENHPTTNSSTVSPEYEEAAFGPGSAEWIAAAKREIKRLRDELAAAHRTHDAMARVIKDYQDER
jgi:hypothetical protein